MPKQKMPTNTKSPIERFHKYFKTSSSGSYSTRELRRLFRQTLFIDPKLLEFRDDNESYQAEVRRYETAKRTIQQRVENTQNASRELASLMAQVLLRPQKKSIVDYSIRVSNHVCDYHNLMDVIRELRTRELEYPINRDDITKIASEIINNEQIVRQAREIDGKSKPIPDFIAHKTILQSFLEKLLQNTNDNIAYLMQGQDIPIAVQRYVADRFIDSSLMAARRNFQSLTPITKNAIIEESVKQDDIMKDVLQPQVQRVAQIFKMQIESCKTYLDNKGDKVSPEDARVPIYLTNPAIERLPQSITNDGKQYSIAPSSALEDVVSVDQLTTYKHLLKSVIGNNNEEGKRGKILSISLRNGAGKSTIKRLFQEYNQELIKSLTERNNSRPGSRSSDSSNGTSSFVELNLASNENDINLARAYKNKIIAIDEIERLFVQLKYEDPQYAKNEFLRHLKNNGNIVFAISASASEAKNDMVKSRSISKALILEQKLASLKEELESLEKNKYAIDGLKVVTAILQGLNAPRFQTRDGTLSVRGETARNHIREVLNTELSYGNRLGLDDDMLDIIEEDLQQKSTKEFFHTNRNGSVIKVDTKYFDDLFQDVKSAFENQLRDAGVNLDSKNPAAQFEADISSKEREIEKAQEEYGDYLDRIKLKDNENRDFRERIEDTKRKIEATDIHTHLNNLPSSIEDIGKFMGISVPVFEDSEEKATNNKRAVVSMPQFFADSDDEDEIYAPQDDFKPKFESGKNYQIIISGADLIKDTDIDESNYELNTTCIDRLKNLAGADKVIVTLFNYDGRVLCVIVDDKGHKKFEQGEPEKIRAYVEARKNGKATVIIYGDDNMVGGDVGISDIHEQFFFSDEILDMNSHMQGTNRDRGGQSKRHFFVTGKNDGSIIDDAANVNSQTMRRRALIKVAEARTTIKTLEDVIAIDLLKMQEILKVKGGNDILEAIKDKAFNNEDGALSTNDANIIALIDGLGLQQGQRDKLVFYMRDYLAKNVSKIHLEEQGKSLRPRTAHYGNILEQASNGTAKIVINEVEKGKFQLYGVNKEIITPIGSREPGSVFSSKLLARIIKSQITGNNTLLEINEGEFTFFDHENRRREFTLKEFLQYLNPKKEKLGLYDEEEVDVTNGKTMLPSQSFAFGITLDDADKKNKGMDPRSPARTARPPVSSRKSARKNDVTPRRSVIVDVENEDLLSEIQKLKLTLESKNSDLAKLKREQAVLQKNHEGELNGLQGHYQQQLRDTQGKLDSLRAQQRALNVANTGSTKEIREKNARVQVLEQQIEQKQREYEALQKKSAEDLASLKSKSDIVIDGLVDKGQQMSQELGVQIRSLKEALQEATSKHETALQDQQNRLDAQRTKEVASLKKQQEASLLLLKDQLQQAQARVASAGREAKDSRSESVNRNRKLNENQLAVDKLNNQIRELQKSQKEETARLREEFAVRENKIKQEADAAKLKSEEVQRTLDDQERRYKQELFEQQKHLAELQKTKESEIGVIRVQLLEEKRVTQELREQISISGRDNKYALMASQSAQRVINQQLAEKEREFAALNKSKDRNEEALRKVNELTNEHQLKIEEQARQHEQQLQEQNRQYTKQLQEKDAQLTRLREEKSAELLDLQRQLAVAKTDKSNPKRAEELQKQELLIAQERDALQAQVVNNEDLMAQIIDQQQGREEKLRALEQERARALEEANKLRAENAVLREERVQMNVLNGFNSVPLVVEGGRQARPKYGSVNQDDIQVNSSDINAIAQLSALHHFIVKADSGRTDTIILTEDKLNDFKQAVSVNVNHNIFKEVFALDEYNSLNKQKQALKDYFGLSGNVEEVHAIKKTALEAFYQDNLPILKDSPTLPLAASDDGGYRNAGGISIKGSQIRISILDAGEDTPMSFDINPPKIGYSIRMTYENREFNATLLNKQNGEEVEYSNLDEDTQKIIDAFDMTINIVTHQRENDIEQFMPQYFVKQKGEKFDNIISASTSRNEPITSPTSPLSTSQVDPRSKAKNTSL